MKVLLTGGTGFLGKNVARALHGRGHDLRVLARVDSNLAGLPPHEVARGDVRDAAALRRAAEGCQAVVHMAALVKMWVPDREEFDRVNVEGLRHVLAAAEAAGARLVYTSSFMAIGPTGPEPADESRIHAGQSLRSFSPMAGWPTTVHDAGQEKTRPQASCAWAGIRNTSPVRKAEMRSVTSRSTRSRSGSESPAISGASGPAMSVSMAQNSVGLRANCESCTRSWRTSVNPAPPSSSARAPSAER